MTESKICSTRSCKFFKLGLFNKFYKSEDLLDLDWKTRVSAIQRLSLQCDLIPKTEFFQGENGGLQYVQLRVRRGQPKPESVKVSLRQLAEELEQLTVNNFIHGDINYKNLLFDGNSYKLIDLEPSLFQRRNGRKTLMYTPPYIALSDLQNDTLTSNTDKVGFYFFCRRMLNPITHFSPLYEMQRIQSGFSIIERFTAISERDFCVLSFPDILNLGDI